MTSMKLQEFLSRFDMKATTERERRLLRAAWTVYDGLCHRIVDAADTGNLPVFGGIASLYVALRFYAKDRPARLKSKDLTPSREDAGIRRDGRKRKRSSKRNTERQTRRETTAA